MLDWDSGTWAGIGLTVLFGLLAVLFWWRPHAPKHSKAPAKHQLLRVEVDNSIPVFDHPDGSRTAGDHYVGVTARNGTHHPVKAVGWGISIPADRSIVVSVPATPWEPRLPCWLQPRDAATWFIEAQQLRDQAAELDIPFDKMIAFVRFADGRQINAAREAPLA